MDHAELVERAKSLIDDLAQTPRFAGSVEEARARARCRAELEQAGFICDETPFAYSQWLGRWGAPLVSLGLGVLLFFLAAGARAGFRAAPGAGAFAMFVVLRLSVVSIRDRWVLKLSTSRATGVNLEAHRGTPLVWLVAHLDSKSQTIPMLLRIAGSVALYFAALLVVFGGLAFEIWGGAFETALRVAQAFALFGAVTAGLCFIRNRSPGAVDNATGVAAVLLAAQSETSPSSLGVLITSGEELGLAGATAWAESTARQGAILNCDTIDEFGVFRCMHSGGEPIRIVMAAEKAAKRSGADLRVRRLVPGVMTDSIVFAHSTRWSAITLSRGTLSTLARIHTRGDNSTKLTGEGVAQASALLSAIARELS